MSNFFIWKKDNFIYYTIEDVEINLIPIITSTTNFSNLIDGFAKNKVNILLPINDKSITFDVIVLIPKKSGEGRYIIGLNSKAYSKAEKSGGSQINEEIPSK